MNMKLIRPLDNTLSEARIDLERYYETHKHRLTPGRRVLLCHTGNEFICGGRIVGLDNENCMAIVEILQVGDDDRFVVGELICIYQPYMDIDTSLEGFESEH